MEVLKSKNAHFFAITAITAVFLFLLSIQPAQAAPKKGFEALQVSAPKSGFTMEPGSTQTVTLEFQNIGTKTWKNSGNAYVSVYTYSPKYRASGFRADNWVDYTQAAILKESSVASKKVGTIELKLKAPLSEGNYNETFQLAAENTAWIPGSEFTLKINVKKKSVVSESSTAAADGVASPVSNKGLSATILIRSSKTVTAEAGATIQYRVGVKNTGTVVWKTREIMADNVVTAEKSEGEVKPGNLDLIDFNVIAPSVKGKQVVKYKLAVNDEVIPDFSIDIPVEVTTGSADVLESPLSVDDSQVLSSNIISEPTLRVGVLIVDEETDWVVEIGCNSDWNLVDGENGLLGEMLSGETVRAFYKNQRYYFNRGKGIEQTYKYLRFVPKDKNAVCTVGNFDRRKTRKAGYADNQFRNVLELRYNKTKDRTWLINELPIDQYLYGLAETSNDSNQEYKKALVTAARTYALYHWERASKHASEFFHVNSTADDQVYNGYGYEVRNPRIKQAVDDTYGVTVNYNKSTALTPYFSRSDGRTRDWSEVWGGKVDWIKSVPTPCDKRKGRKLLGHGVGMSATEALCMAEENGKKWEDIIGYFFQNIELIQRWKKE